MSKHFLRNELLRLIAYSIVIALLHYFLLWKLLPAKYLAAQPWRIYAFLVPVTLAGAAYIIKRFQQDHKSVVNTFMLFTILKMIGALLFLGIIMFYFKEPARVMIYQFFALFFLFLFIEIRLFIRMLSFSPDKTEKK